TACVSPATVSTAPMSPVASELPPTSESRVVSESAMTPESPVPFESHATVSEGAVLPVDSVGEEWSTSIPESHAAEPNGQRVAAVGSSASVQGVTPESENLDGLDTGGLSCQATAPISEDSAAAISKSDQPPSVSNDSRRPGDAVGEDAATKRDQEM